MLELILLVLSLLSLAWSAEAAVSCLLLAVGIGLFRRRTLADEMEQLRASLTQSDENLYQALQKNNEKLDKLTREVSELRAAGVTAAAPSAAEAVLQKPTTTKVAEAPPVISAKAETEVSNPAVALVAAPEAVSAAAKPPAAREIVAPPKQVSASPVSTSQAEEAPERQTTVHEVGPVLPPPQPVIPTQPSASYSVPSPTMPLRTAPAKPRRTLQEWAASVFAFEEILGKRWLSKIGIILVVLGLASLGIYQLGSTPSGKVALLLTGSLVLLAGGIYLERSERYQILGRAGIGGGWALLFFTAYAAHHVQAMTVLPLESTDLLLMLGVAVGMALHTLRYKSQVVTGLAFLLAYSTASLSHDTVYALSGWWPRYRMNSCACAPRSRPAVGR